MTKTGTAMERSSEVLPDSSAGQVLPVEIVRNEAEASLDVARAQDARAQRVEVANRVLSLLGSLGNLALRIIELRSSASGPSSGAARPSSPRGVTSEPEARRGLEVRQEPRAAIASGYGARRRRQGRRRRRAG